MSTKRTSISKLAISLYVIGGFLLLYLPFGSLLAIGLIFADSGYSLGSFLTLNFLVELLQPIAIILMGGLAQQVHELRVSISSVEMIDA